MKVRNIMLAGVFSICLGTAVFAQKGVMIGVNGTLGLSYMLAQNTYYLAENSKELDYKAKFSYNTAFHVGYNFKESHGFQFFGGYCHEGQNYQDEFKWKKYPELIGTHTKQVDFDFVNFGVLYRWSPILPGQKEKNPEGNYGDGRYKIRMKLLAGVETDFLLNADMAYQIDHKAGTKNGIKEEVGYPIDPAIGGYPAYTPHTGSDYKDYFKSVQAALLFKWGFDYITKPNVYLGFALQGKFGLNDINAEPFQVHPDYKKSKNYFIGLNVELGYIFQKGQKKDDDEAKKKPEELKDDLVDVNKQVDKLDKATKKKIRKTKY